MSETKTTGTIIDHLTADHQQIKALFSDVMFVRPENRADAYAQLVAALVQHEVAEELVVYPEVGA
ncbi:MAG TPA: hemerythrin domain-containing protein, partial [Acidimicrobiales bacterium]|nr:hemerythrin domain-containing protein [Acidimicrobiales bacterium]